VQELVLGELLDVNPVAAGQRVVAADQYRPRLVGDDRPELGPGRPSVRGAAISKHIKVLERAGLVVRARRAQYRPCALDPAPLQEVSTWAQRCRSDWEARFDRMDDYLARFAPPPGTDDHDD
jgi:hypothetical protein